MDCTYLAMDSWHYQARSTSNPCRRRSCPLPPDGRGQGQDSPKMTSCPPRTRRGQRAREERGDSVGARSDF